jgi:hypothetical protein
MVCEPNLVGQKVLESAVINALVDWYRPYLGGGGRRKLEEAVKAQVCVDKEELVAACEQAEINQIVNEGIEFIARIESTLRHGLPKARMATLRQCVERMWVNKPRKKTKVEVRVVPVGDLRASVEVERGCC